MKSKAISFVFIVTYMSLLFFFYEALSNEPHPMPLIKIVPYSIIMAGVSLVTLFGAIGMLRAFPHVTR